MAKEIERRFLVQSLAKDMPKPSRKINIEQGYFEMADIGRSFRVRICDGENGYITMKTSKGFIREELQHSVDIKFAKLLMEGCHHKLNKTRWLINGWEIDRYWTPLEGVIIAERELKSADEKLVLPRWLKGVIEVTETLTNHHLARLATDLKGADVVAMPYLSSHILNMIPRIVLTGGPCSGKSTIIESIKKDRPDIHCVPEMATIVIGQFGITPSKDVVKNRHFQKAVYRAQRIFEATSNQFAISDNKKAILFDRGAMDGAAYMTGGIKEFKKFFNTTLEAEYSQYDAVICLDIPPSDVYEANRRNNPVRSENYDQACKLGEKIVKAWVNHPNFFMIPNGTGWKDKERMAKKAIETALK